MARKKIEWGTPGETGVTKDGIPWAVPEEGPSRFERFMERVLPSPGGVASMPPGARLVRARTAADAQERCMRKYGEGIAGLLDEDGGERLVGFTQFLLDDDVPQPPRGGIEARVGPNPLKRWWMGGGWDTMAGQLIVAIGSSRIVGSRVHGAVPRRQLLVRTDRRVVIRNETMEDPGSVIAEYGLDQIGIRPGFAPGGRAADDEGWRVDIAFADGSWLGATGTNDNYVPGGSDFPADRDLLAELLGPPVTSTVLPALGRE